MSKLKIHLLTAYRMPFQTTHHGSANDAATASFASAAALGYIQGVLTTKYLASPYSKNHFEVLAAESGGCFVQA
jgi:hypothetical protein